MKKYILLLLTTIAIAQNPTRNPAGFYAGSTTMNTSAIGQFDSTAKGFLFPRMTTTQRNAIFSPATSLVIFNTTTGAYNYYNGSAWVTFGSGGVSTVTGPTVNNTDPLNPIVNVSNLQQSTDAGDATTNDIVLYNSNYTTIIGKGQITLDNETDNRGLQIEGYSGGIVWSDETLNTTAMSFDPLIANTYLKFPSRQAGIYKFAVTPIVVSANITAENDTNYTVTASSTITDPTGVNGKGYIVYVRTGTATIGGVGYGVGSLVYRFYNGAWTSKDFNSAGAGGTVTDFLFTNANGVTGSVSTSTTIPTLVLSLGAITPTTVTASGAISGTNLSGTNTGDQTITLTGGVTGSGTGSFATTLASGIDATKIADGTVTSSEFQFINSLTSNAQTQIDGKQASLVSGTNIKTINGTTLLGSGDLVTTQTTVTGNAGTATALQNTRTIGTITGDATSSGSAFNGTANNTNTITFSTVNSNIGIFGSTSKTVTTTVNAKGLTTAISEQNIVIPQSQVTSLVSDLSTINANIATKEPTITATTSADYYRGDKTFATLNKTSVGLSNVDNTSDTYKPVSTAQQTAIDLKMTKTSNGSDIANVATFRANLGVDKLTLNGDSNYTILSTDKAVATSATITAPRTWTLPLANSVNSGYEIIVADLFGGVTSTNTIIISRAGSDLINGSTSQTIAAPFGMRRLISDGVSKWTFDGGVMRISDYIGTTLTASKVVVTDVNGKLAPSTTTTTQIGYLSGATGTTGTTSTNLVFSASPAFTGPTTLLGTLAITGTPSSGVSTPTTIVGGTGTANGGFKIGSFTTDTGGLWSNAVTPSTSNYMIVGNTTNTEISAPTTLRLNISGNIINTINTNGMTMNTAKSFTTAAGTATVAPFKIPSGTNLTTTQAGAIENNGTNLFVTFANSGARFQLDRQVLAGSYSSTGTATTTFTVTIGSTMANNTYKVNVTPTSSLSAALFYVTNKTATTFDVVYLAGLTGTVTFDYSVVP